MRQPSLCGCVAYYATFLRRFDVVVVSEELARRRARVPGTMVDRALSEGRVIAES
jgi:hypothetical protein